MLNLSFLSTLGNVEILMALGLQAAFMIHSIVWPCFNILSTQVIHFDLPNNSEIFVHRSGRTGRAGKKGTAILIYTQDQTRAVKIIERDVGCRFSEVIFYNLLFSLFNLVYFEWLLVYYYLWSSNIFCVVPSGVGVGFVLLKYRLLQEWN